MPKRKRKGEKLDFIISELSALRADIQKLLEPRAEGARAKARPRSRPASSKPAKKAPTKATTKPKAVAKPAPAKPVLVEIPPAEQSGRA
jgi:hypothetical protein